MAAAFCDQNAAMPMELTPYSMNHTLPQVHQRWQASYRHGFMFMLENAAIHPHQVVP
ncbi:hypothetical protein RI056_17520 [Komagataeibacter nataicola]|nr:hypothetical protein RI056_17520 [Komagataeibacter nataicola]